MKMPLVLAVSAVAVASVAALFRPHGSPALRTTTDAPGHHATFVQVRDASPADASPARVVVYVTGEVKRPGVYTVDARSRVEGALRAASGATAKADLQAVNLAEPLVDGERVLVPAKGAAGDVAATDAYASTAMPSTASTSTYSASSHASSRHRHRRASSTTSGHHSRGHRTHKVPPAEPIDINAADASQLEQLPGIGPSLAERIVTFRDVNGPYHSTDELLDVSGMTDKRLDAISAYVVVRSP